MQVIWKEILRPVSQQAVNMTVDAEILYVGEQQGKVVIWYKLDPAERAQERTIYIVGTGVEFDFEGRYIGTVLFGEGSLVLHVFEEKK